MIANPLLFGQFSDSPDDHRLRAMTVIHKTRISLRESGAHDGIRTRDLFLTKEVLYRLSYMGIRAMHST
jgi:hypothetical protein